MLRFDGIFCKILMNLKIILELLLDSFLKIIEVMSAISEGATAKFSFL